MLLLHFDANVSYSIIHMNTSNLRYKDDTEYKECPPSLIPSGKVCRKYLKMPKEANKLGDSNKKTGIEPRIPIGRRRYVAQCKPASINNRPRFKLRITKKHQ